MPFYCLRHPEPDIARGICYGRSDIPLKPVDDAFYAALDGKLEASLADMEMILASPLQRCRISAEELGRLTNLPVQIDERLIEIDFGYWETQRYDLLWENDPVYRKWCEHWVESETPGGDSFLKMQMRLDSLCSEYKNRSLILYTHAGIIRALMCLLEGISPEEAFSRKISYNEMIIME